MTLLATAHAELGGTDAGATVRGDDSEADTRPRFVPVKAEGHLCWSRRRSR